MAISIPAPGIGPLGLPYDVWGCIFTLSSRKELAMLNGTNRWLRWQLLEQESWHETLPEFKIFQARIFRPLGQCTPQKIVSLFLEAAVLPFKFSKTASFPDALLRKEDRVIVQGPECAAHLFDLSCPPAFEPLFLGPMQFKGRLGNGDIVVQKGTTLEVWDPRQPISLKATLPLGMSKIQGIFHNVQQPENRMIFTDTEGSVDVWDLNRPASTPKAHLHLEAQRISYCAQLINGDIITKTEDTVHVWGLDRLDAPKAHLQVPGALRISYCAQLINGDIITKTEDTVHVWCLDRLDAPKAKLHLESQRIFYCAQLKRGDIVTETATEVQLWDPNHLTAPKARLQVPEAQKISYRAQLKRGDIVTETATEVQLWTLDQLDAPKARLKMPKATRIYYCAEVLNEDIVTVTASAMQVWTSVAKSPTFVGVFKASGHTMISVLPNNEIALEVGKDVHILGLGEHPEELCAAILKQKIVDNEEVCKLPRSVLRILCHNLGKFFPKETPIEMLQNTFITTTTFAQQPALRGFLDYRRLQSAAAFWATGDSEEAQAAFAAVSELRKNRAYAALPYSATRSSSASDPAQKFNAATTQDKLKAIATIVASLRPADMNPSPVQPG